MTGFGAGQAVVDGVAYAVEIRAVNHRYLKLSIRLPESSQFSESAIDELLRDRLFRGSVSYALRIRSATPGDLAAIDKRALAYYIEKLAESPAPAGVQRTVDLAALALLPGVIQTPEADESLRESQLAAIREATTAALDALVAMRDEEGKSLKQDLLHDCARIESLADAVAERSPAVAAAYHQRLRSRVQQLMAEGGFELAVEDLAREVAVYAERCDISEELSRLRSHLEQWRQLCDRDGQVGRTLDFLAQELLREANTIASKANDALIAQHIVAVKTHIDRLKEQVQNVE